MRVMRLCALTAVSSLALFLFSGCGSGGGTLPGNVKPASFGEDRFRPNYGGDLYAAAYWPESTVTYRILAAGTSEGIYPGSTIGVVVATSDQSQSVRDAFSKWQAALAGGDPVGFRRFVETTPADTTADIDVAVQRAADFSSASIFFEEFGETDTFVKDDADGIMGRAVVRIRGDLAVRTFRYTALHEVGHSIGLLANGISGHSRHAGDIMYAIEPTIVPAVDLDRDDINTIRADYVRPLPP